MESGSRSKIIKEFSIKNIINMNSLFDTQYSTEIINRINKLTPDTKAQWGKMSVSQMMAHCTEALRSAYGELKLKRTIFGMLMGPIAKKSVLSDKPYKHGLPTDKHFVIKDDKNFDEEKTKLISYVKKFDESSLSKDAHPFFGKMTIEQWDKLMSKHLDHHLKQFGA
jgi:hypothetical protein